MKSLALLLVFLLAMPEAGALRAQGLPAGYKPLEEAPASVSINVDLDGDGKTDALRAAVKGEESDARLVAQLAKGKMIVSGPLSMCCGSISAKGGVVDVHSKGMRGFTYYKFRWEKAAGDFRLIGYDTESFGNAVHDGSGTTSLNLLTGNYEAALNSWNEKKQDLTPHKVKRKIAVGKKIYLRGFDEQACDWLSDLNYKQLPKELQ